jgi:S-adenosylmethionine:tRNA ribosyltransferase-isomerase
VLPKNALLVLNETRVVHARIRFKRTTGALLECMVLTPEAGRTIEQALQDEGRTRWWCMMGNAKRWKGEPLVLEHGGVRLEAVRVEQANGEHLIEFRWNTDASFIHILARAGAVPLPPYMRREAMPEDDARYNTVFAKRDGSVAAPTASLHVSEAIMGALRTAGFSTARITLHVGAGTFLPVKSAVMADHAMHAEEIHVSATALRQLIGQVGSGPIVPVGTTALRTLESLYWHGVKRIRGSAASVVDIDQWEPYRDHGTRPAVREALAAVLDGMGAHGELTGRTRLLIAPGYRFQVADALVTNFHQPQSTLLLLVAAFVGPRWREMYHHALQHGYRFLSYGDGSLLFRAG